MNDWQEWPDACKQVLAAVRDAGIAPYSIIAANDGIYVKSDAWDSFHPRWLYADDTEKVIGSWIPALRAKCAEAQP